MVNNRIVPYFGNGPYCYANAAAMLLSYIGEEISPKLVEVLSGVGLGAVLLGQSQLPFFNTYSGAPDRGISQALKILGFSFTERSYPYEGDDPFPDLTKDLKMSPVILGPLDMGFLDYNPRVAGLSGVDHFVLAYGLDTREVQLHDPAGFPFVSVFREQLRKAWQAKGIGYRRDFYRSWSGPKRIAQPSEKEIFNSACEFFRQLYREDGCRSKDAGLTAGKEVFSAVAQKVAVSGLSDLEIGHLTHFALPLAARRAADFAEFFQPFDDGLANLKKEQALAFGRSHTLLMRRGYKDFASQLRDLAESGENFRQKLLNSDKIN